MFIYNQPVEVLSFGKWLDAVWKRKVKRSGGRTWHVCKFRVTGHSGDIVEIPSCGMFLYRSQIRKIK